MSRSSNNRQDYLMNKALAYMIEAEIIAQLQLGRVLFYTKGYPTIILN